MVVKNGCGGEQFFSSKQRRFAVMKKEGRLCEGASNNNLVLTMQLRRKIHVFRDFMDLPSCDASISINELVIETMEDLHKLYPEIVANREIMKMRREAQDYKGLAYFCNALKSIGDALKMNSRWMDKTSYEEINNIEGRDLGKIVRILVATLDGLIQIVKEKFDMVDEDCASDNNRKQSATSSGDVSPTSVISEPPNMVFSKKQSLLLPLRVKLNPVDVNRLELQFFPAVDGAAVAVDSQLAELQRYRRVRPTSSVPSSPPLSIEQVDAPPSKRPDLPVPPPPPVGKAMSPPPPPPFKSGKPMLTRSDSKLKRSAQMGNLYRLLKGKVEGSSLTAANSRRKGSIGSSNGGKQGMADALKEMTKRSAYFQQIEEDVKKYATQIMELKASIISFHTKDMKELVQFHEQVESVLESLTDESQILSRFEEFPTKKLEALRAAGGLYRKLDGLMIELQNWKIVAPLPQLMDKVDRYFNKMKVELENIERVKDEESKTYARHSIHFNFDILVRIKEAIVDVSSSCMELALKESREAKANASAGVDQRRTSIKMLWRAFQFAFRVYTFAGGHDDRADSLTKELAYEIQTDPEN